MDNNKQQNIRDQCRACLNAITSNGAGQPQVTNSLLSPNLCGLFLDFTTLDVSQEVEEFPKQLCPLCSAKLIVCDDFRKKALESTRTLYQTLKNHLVEDAGENNVTEAVSIFVKEELSFGDKEIDPNDESGNAEKGNSFLKKELSFCNSELDPKDMCDAVMNENDIDDFKDYIDENDAIDDDDSGGIGDDDINADLEKDENNAIDARDNDEGENQHVSDTEYDIDDVKPLSIMTADSYIKLRNLKHQNSNNLTTPQTVFNNSGSEGQNLMHVQPVTLEGMVENFSKVIEPMFIRLTNEVTSLRQEIKGLRDEVKELKKDKTAVKLVMPENPYKIMDDFLNFEKNLQEKNFLNSFGKELLTVAKTPNFIKNCWRMLLVDELAEKLCWKGTEEKRSVRSLRAAKAIRNAAISIGLSDDEYVKTTKSFFQFAKNRQELRKKYKAKTKIIKS